MSELAVQVDNLSVTLGAHRALEGISLRVPEGAFLAALGPNGAGKSTLFKTLLGLIEPSAGSVKLFGRAPRDVPPDWIGYVPQMKTLNRTFPARAVDLAMTGATRRWPWGGGGGAKKRALEALDRVGASGLASRSIAKLSGGELQRVYLARAMTRNPKLILLDEPLTGVDAAGELDMYEILESCQKEIGATVLMITHDWETAHHHASHALILNRRMIGFGPPRETLTDQSLREAFSHIGHEHPLCIGEHKHD